MKNNIKKIGIAILAMVAFASCNDEEDLILVNPNGKPAEIQTNNLQELLQISIASYAPLQTTGLYARHMFYIHDGMSDEAQGSGMEADKQQMNDYSLDAANIGTTLYWQSCYIGVGNTNRVIDAKEKILSTDVANISKSDQNFSIGEAYFMRAYYYFLLTSRFGDVPLRLTSPKLIEDQPIKKSTRADVYASIMSDLNNAIELLPSKAEIAEDNYGRATRDAANALAARVLLVNGNQYAKALPYLDAVISTNTYTLAKEYVSNFDIAGEHGSESIWEVMFDDSYALAGAWDASASGIAETSFRSQEYCWGNLSGTVPLQAAFDQDPKADPRKGITLNLDTGGNNGKWAKYSYTNIRKDRDCNFPASGINFRVLRYADVLLMKAECLNALDGGVDEILELMNATRKRVKLDLFGSDELNNAPAGKAWPVSTKEERLAAIQHERRVEFAGEQLRLNDILRWDIISESLKAARNIAYDPTKDALLPIPTVEIDNNPALTQADQNPGY